MEEEKIKKPWWHDSLIFFIKVSGWIVGPIIIVIIIESILEKYFEVPRFVFMFMMSFGFIFSIFGLVKESRKYIDEAGKKSSSDSKIEEK